MDTKLFELLSARDRAGVKAVLKEAELTRLSYGSDYGSKELSNAVLKPTSFTALTFALQYRINAVDLLLENRADPNKLDEQGKHPLLVCINRRDEKSLCLLFKYGANPAQILNEQRWRPIHLVSYFGWKEALEHVIKQLIIHALLRWEGGGGSKEIGKGGGWKKSDVVDETAMKTKKSADEKIARMQTDAGEGGGMGGGAVDGGEKWVHRGEKREGDGRTDGNTEESLGLFTLSSQRQRVLQERCSYVLDVLHQQSATLLHGHKHKERARTPKKISKRGGSQGRGRRLTSFQSTKNLIGQNEREKARNNLVLKNILGDVPTPACAGKETTDFKEMSGSPSDGTSSLFGALSASQFANLSNGIRASKLESRTANGKTALMIASERNSVACARILLSCGCSPFNQMPSLQQNTMHLAAVRGNTDVALEIIDWVGDSILLSREGLVERTALKLSRDFQQRAFFSRVLKRLPQQHRESFT